MRATQSLAFKSFWTRSLDELSRLTNIGRKKPRNPLDRHREPQPNLLIICTYRTDFNWLIPKQLSNPKTSEAPRPPARSTTSRRPSQSPTASSSPTPTWAAPRPRISTGFPRPTATALHQQPLPTVSAPPTPMAENRTPQSPAAMHASTAPSP